MTDIEKEMYNAVLSPLLTCEEAATACYEIHKREMENNYVPKSDYLDVVERCVKAERELDNKIQWIESLEAMHKNQSETIKAYHQISRDVFPEMYPTSMDLKKEILKLKTENETLKRQLKDASLF